MPGQWQTQTGLPLERFLPPHFPGMATSWVGQFAEPGSWILDPFCADPFTDLELARSGYRVLVTANNPVAAFIVEVLASAPSATELVDALQALAGLRMSDGERFEDYICSFYQLPCPQCDQIAEVTNFIWEEDHSEPQILQITCPHCDFSADLPATAQLLQSLKTLPSYALHRSRALELAASPDDPLRSVMDEVIRFYSPRALILLQALLNKISDPSFIERQRTLLQALFLTTADQMNQLWAYPLGRNRPHQLIRPPAYQETNLWHALLRSLNIWQAQEPEIVLKPWPGIPPQKGGISLFRGRLRELDPLPEPHMFSLATSALPRRNQAYWHLSGLWTGWLWGKEALSPLRHSLLRQRYDWTWHTYALTKVLSHLPKMLQAEKPILLQIGELDPLFMLSGLLGAQEAGLQMQTYALDGEESTLQTVWRLSSSPLKPIGQSLQLCAQQAVQDLLTQKGEPASHLVRLTKIALQAHTKGLLANQPQAQPNHTLNELQAELERVLLDTTLLSRYNPGATLESGLYWLAGSPKQLTPLVEKLETDLLALLAENPHPRDHEVLQKAYLTFPGLLTPPSELIETVLSAYADKIESEIPTWQLRAREASNARQRDLREMVTLLEIIAKRLNYNIKRQGEVINWHDQSGDLIFSFFLLLTTVITPLIYTYNSFPGEKYIVLPASRSNLLTYKLRRDPHLQELCEESWHFIKFRQVRILGAEPLLTRESFPVKILEDPPEYQRSQLPLF